MKDRLMALLERRNRLSTQLYLAIGGAVVFTVAASLVGWFSFNQVSAALQRVNEDSVPELVAAFGVAQHSGTLAAAAPRLTTAETSRELSTVASEITMAHQSLQGELAILGQQGVGGDEFDRIQASSDTLRDNALEIEQERAEIFELTEHTEALRKELGEQLLPLVNRKLVPAVDDQLFFTMTGYSSREQAQAERVDYFSEDELRQYRHLADLQADAAIAAHLLESAFSVSEAPLLEPLRERFESSAGRIEGSLSALEGSPLYADVAPALDRLIDSGLGEQSAFDLLDQEWVAQPGERWVVIGDQGGFDLLDRVLRLDASQRELLEINRNLSLDLVAQVDGLVSAANARAQQASAASTQATFTGRILLIAITVLSIGGALLIAWLFVGRVILKRLQMLSDWMRRMAGGDLEAQVEIGGRDEVADMAAALEVFRLHALEVQRLNLVEELANELRELADELQGKNEQLEVTLADLEKAQDQIVMREKLAALGELTAGVAHEIRNPLNFVKNFSEVSSELVTELNEVLEEGGDSLPEDQRKLIQDISDDLSSNLERIGSHTERANRIVHDMLMMGRGSTEFQPTNINSLLEEYARLAYHSARAVDTEFQLTLQNDLDPEMGEMDVIPQDLGRVFLNMVGNACYATDEKRRSLLENGSGGGEPYFPTVWLTTKRDEERVEVRIRDNGNGMPPDVVEKIFNPFFTTKPTGQGTGLGLAISNDIIREHGGSIRVETEPGEFTEMIVELPIRQHSAAASA